MDLIDSSWIQKAKTLSQQDDDSLEFSSSHLLEDIQMLDLQYLNHMAIFVRENPFPLSVNEEIINAFFRQELQITTLNSTPQSALYLLILWYVDSEEFDDFFSHCPSLGKSTFVEKVISLLHSLENQVNENVGFFLHFFSGALLHTKRLLLITYSLCRGYSNKEQFKSAYEGSYNLQRRVPIRQIMSDLKNQQFLLAQVRKQYKINQRKKDEVISTFLTSRDSRSHRIQVANYILRCFEEGSMAHMSNILYSLDISLANFDKNSYDQSIFLLGILSDRKQPNFGLFAYLFQNSRRTYCNVFYVYRQGKTTRDQDLRIEALFTFWHAEFYRNRLRFMEDFARLVRWKKFFRIFSFHFSFRPKSIFDESMFYERLEE